MFKRIFFAKIVNFLEKHRVHQLPTFNALNSKYKKGIFVSTLTPAVSYAGRLAVAVGYGLLDAYKYPEKMPSQISKYRVSISGDPPR
jgi:hypothetical protein